MAAGHEPPACPGQGLDEVFERAGRFFRRLDVFFGVMAACSSHFLLHRSARWRAQPVQSRRWAASQSPSACRFAQQRCCVKGVAPQFVDDDVNDFSAHLRDGGFQQVMRQGRPPRLLAVGW